MIIKMECLVLLLSQAENKNSTVVNSHIVFDVCVYVSD